MEVSLQCDLNSVIGKNFQRGGGGGDAFTAFAGFDELEWFMNH